MSEQPKAPLSPGSVVAGRYRVVREIGGGGMGYVFEVAHIALERPFALKVLRVGQWNDELVQRFEREARALGRLRTPRVAQVTDFGVAPGTGPYYVMELIDGESLQDRLDRDAVLPPPEAVALGVELCEAVADVHAAQIVHRDLKPGNIGLPRSGPVRVKLLDFGLAAGVDDQFLTRITQSHQVLGSLPYIAPEQFSGARPSHAQDLWALGIVLFEMLTGRLPFDAPSTAALMHAILTAPVPILEGVPPRLADVVGRLLVKNPAGRITSAAEAAAMLRAVDVTQLPPTIETPAHLPPTRMIPSVSSMMAGHPPQSSPPTAAQAHQPAATAPQGRIVGGASIPPTSHSQSYPDGGYQRSIPPTTHAHPVQASSTTVPPAPPTSAKLGRVLVLGVVLGGLSAVGAMFALSKLADADDAQQAQDAPPPTATAPRDAGAPSLPDAGPLDGGPLDAGAEVEETAPRTRPAVRMRPTMRPTPMDSRMSPPTMDATNPPAMDSPMSPPAIDPPAMEAAGSMDTWMGGIIDLDP